MRKFTKLLGLLFGGGLILGVFLIIILRIALSFAPNPWPEPLPHVQLEPTRPFLKGADVTETNAYFYIRQLGAFENINSQAFKDENQDFNKTGWVDGVYTNLTQWAFYNQAPLALADKAAALPFCQIETYTSVTNALPYIKPILGISRGLQFNAEAAAASNDWEKAVTHLRKIMVLNDHITRGGVLISRLVGIAGGSIGCTSMQRMAEDYPMPAPVSRKLIALLEKLDAEQEPFVEAIRYERQFGQMCVEVAFNNGLEAIAGFTKKNPLNVMQRSGWLIGSGKETVSAHLDLIYAHMINAATLERYDREKELLEEKIILKLKDHPFLMMAHDPLGRFMAVILIPPGSSAQVRHFEYMVNLRGTRISLALRQYAQDHEGRLPESLQELVPNYLTSNPVDPFNPNGKPLQYRKQDGDWTVYSLGANQADGGGQHNGFDREVRRNNKDDYDLVFASDAFAQRRLKYAAEE